MAEDCITDKPRLKRLIDEHEVMKVTLAKLEPSIDNLIRSMDGLAAKVGDVHDNHNDLHSKVESYVSKIVGAIVASGALVGIVTALLAYIYVSDQRATERHIMSLVQEHKQLQEMQAKSSAERELMFKALLKVIDSKK